MIEPTALRVEGSFRGQPLTYRTEVKLHPVPDTVAIGPPPPEPPDASLAVRASQEIIDRFGEGTGSIAIVLDCSGSMVDPIPGTIRRCQERPDKGTRPGPQGHEGQPLDLRPDSRRGRDGAGWQGRPRPVF